MINMLINMLLMCAEVFFLSDLTESSVAYCGLSTTKCRHGLPQKGSPPDLEHRETRATTDIKHVLTSDGPRAVAVTA